MAKRKPKTRIAKDTGRAGKARKPKAQKSVKPQLRPPKDVRALWVHADTLHVLCSRPIGEPALRSLHRKSGVRRIKSMLVDDFFKEVMEYNTKLLVSIRDGRVLYDSLDLVKVLELNIKKGLMAGTKEMLLRKFMIIRKEIGEIESTKTQVFENIYTSCLEAAQAALVSRGKAILIPKKVPELLTVNLLGKGLERTHIAYCQEIIATYKAIEHKKRPPLTGEELDRLARKAELFRDAVKRVS